MNSIKKKMANLQIEKDEQKKEMDSLKLLANAGKEEIACFTKTVHRNEVEIAKVKNDAERTRLSTMDEISRLTAVRTINSVHL